MTSVKITSERINPFPGLRPFTSADKGFFFGRKGEVDDVTDKLIKNRFVAVIGNSGSGKSSLINCGLYNKIAGISESGPEKWRICSFRPGIDPFGNLADSMIVNMAPDAAIKSDRDAIVSILKKSDEGIQDAIKVLTGKNSGNTLILIDQFEELFRFGSGGNDPATGRFIEAVKNIVESNKLAVYIVIAIDSDHITDLSQFKEFTRLLNNSNFLIPRMNRENFREVIEGPSAAAGTAFDAELVEVLLNDLTGRADQLPVLQHALMRIWSGWEEPADSGRAPGISDYISIGTLMDSVSVHANNVYDELSEAEKLICEKLFRFITKTRTTEKGTRFPSALSTIRSSINCTGEELSAVVNKFSDPSISILTYDSAPELNDDSVIDISYECLVRLWDRLGRWINEEAESVQIYLRLSDASALYQLGKAGLLRQPELQLAINWRDQFNPVLGWAQKYNPAFERAMVYLRTSEKEYLEAEDRKARLHSWKLRRTRIFTSILGGVALLTLFLMTLTFIGKLSSDKLRREAERMNEELAEQRFAAEEYATFALKRSIEADSIAIVAACKEQAEREQREFAENLAAGTRKDYDLVLEARLKSDLDLKVALEQKIETHRQRMISVAKSMSLRSFQEAGKKDLQTLLAYQAYLFNKRNNGHPNDADIYHGLYNMAKLNGSPVIKSFRGHESQIRSLAFVPGKREFFTSGSDGNVLKWNLDNPDQKYQIVYSNTELIDVMAVSPGAEWLACGGEYPAIRMVPVKGGESVYELKGHSAKVRSLVFSSDGRYLYSAALDGKVLRWDLSTRIASGLSTDMLQITSIDLSADNNYIAGLSSEGSALVWNQAQDSEKFRIETPGKSIRSIRFKPDAQKIGIGYDDGTIEIWDLAARKKESEVMAHDGAVNDIRFSTTTKLLASAGSDSTLKLWDTDDMTNQPVRFDDIGGLVIAFDFSSGGDVIVAAGVDDRNIFLGRPTKADALAANACTYITRNFTQPEWMAFAGKDIEYEKTCSENEYKIRIREIK